MNDLLALFSSSAHFFLPFLLFLASDMKQTISCKSESRHHQFSDWQSIGSDVDVDFQEGIKENRLQFMREAFLKET